MRTSHAGLAKIIHLREEPMIRSLAMPTVALFLCLILTACSPKTLYYKLDPDFGNINENIQKAELVALQVTDKRSLPSLKEEQLNVKGPEQEVELLRSLLIERFKSENKKIISKPLLADLAFLIEIKQLEVILSPGTFKSEFSATSHFQLTVTKKGETWSKIFRASRTQEVANPVNSNEATGLINQLLSEQFNKAFSDSGLKQLIEQ
jgi:uncharacterized lipoprotein YajG